MTTLENIFCIGNDCSAQEEKNVELYDETDGIFGELIDAHHIALAIREDSLKATVGTPKVPSCPPIILRSMQYNDNNDEVPLEIDNMSSNILRVRWIDQEGKCPSETHAWTVRPSSVFQQITRAGHLFIISTMGHAEQEDLFDSQNLNEKLLGAYRPKRQLPSKSPHNLLVENNPDAEGSLIMEVLLLDGSKYDAQVVASALLDDMHKIRSREDCHSTLEVLSAIIQNILLHPTEPKYCKLRLENKKIHKSIATVWPALEFLRATGFQNDRIQSAQDDSHFFEEFLIFPKCPLDAKSIERLNNAIQLLQILNSRHQDDFIEDIAPRTPWQEPIPVVSHASSRWGQRSLHFITDEERWHRAELNRQRRGRAGRPPNPGEAPSSRGAWGR